MNWYFEVLRKYAEFGGRARRQEYWTYMPLTLLIGVVLAAADEVTGLNEATGGLGPLRALYALAVLIPGLAVSVRRLHDIGRSGWWLLMAFLPLVGPVILMLFMVRPGDTEANDYGDDPKSRFEAYAYGDAESW
jgi:uncharacterized membrane protein YhaH (DUF805 family)